MTNLRLALAAGLVAILLAGSADSQIYGSAQGRFGSYGLGGLSWESSCRKPVFYMGDNDQAFADYQTYVRCLRRQAEADASFASRKVSDDAAEELRQVNRDGQLAGVLSY